VELELAEAELAAAVELAVEAVDTVGGFMEKKWSRRREAGGVRLEAVELEAGGGGT
jgi:coproporphyrinogen III oxidase